MVNTHLILRFITSSVNGCGRSNFFHNVDTVMPQWRAFLSKYYIFHHLWPNVRLYTQWTCINRYCIERSPCIKRSVLKATKYCNIHLYSVESVFGGQPVTSGHPVVPHSDCLIHCTSNRGKFLENVICDNRYWHKLIFCRHGTENWVRA